MRGSHSVQRGVEQALGVLGIGEEVRVARQERQHVVAQVAIECVGDVRFARGWLQRR